MFIALTETGERLHLVAEFSRERALCGVHAPYRRVERMPAHDWNVWREEQRHATCKRCLARKTED